MRERIDRKEKLHWIYAIGKWIRLWYNMNRLMESTHAIGSWNRLMEETHGIDSWNRLTD